MSSRAISPAAHHVEPYRHEAAFYAGVDEFVELATAFIREGRAEDEPTLVVVGAHKIELLREALNGDASRVRFADMADVGSNPARIIPAWREFLDEHHVPGRRIRGIGEPIHPERGEAELVECHRHESLLNLAFADSDGFRLLCPYDVGALEPAVVAEARRTHPLVSERGVRRTSSAYDGLEPIAEPFSDPLPVPPVRPALLAFDIDALGAVRRLVADHADAAGLSEDRRHDLVLAVDEVASNSISHGGGHGVLRVWRQDGAVVAEVRDRGDLSDPLAGRRRPAPGRLGGQGLWMANQLCDLVQLRASDTGSIVRLHMRAE